MTEKKTPGKAPLRSTTHSCIMISPDWAYTSISQPTGTHYQFISDTSCPGFSLVISNWCLREAPRQARQGEHNLPHWYSMLLDLLGVQAFTHSTGVIRQFNAQRAPESRGSGLCSSPTIASPDPADKLQQIKPAFEDALRRDINTPQMQFLLFPLLQLMGTDDTPYIIEQRPWPFATPPDQILHTARTGFDSGLPHGILARSKADRTFWIVRKFSPCKVRLSPNAIRKLFPEMIQLAKDMTAETARLLQKRVGVLRKQARANMPPRQPAEPRSHDTRPTILLSDDFLTTSCNTPVLHFTEARQRSRQTDQRMRKLFENWQQGNHPMPLAELNPADPLRADKLFDRTKYPQTAKLVEVTPSNQVTNDKLVRLSPAYNYQLVPSRTLSPSHG